MKLLQAYHLIFILLITSLSVTIANIAKTGCNDTCGTIKIPFPFGIGPNCSVNQWYAIDCNSSIPYLAALNHLEVLAIDLLNATVTLSAPRITDCQNSVQSSTKIFGEDFGRSPFFFSKLDAKFVFYGCGSAVMMDKGNAFAGCSTTCRNATLTDRHNCNGTGCCQTLITQNFNSYTIKFAGLEDGVCSSAFLADEPLHTGGRMSNPFAFWNASFNPISLMWTLTDSDQVTCCNESVNFGTSLSQLEFFNGTLIDSQELGMLSRFLLESIQVELFNGTLLPGTRSRLCYYPSISTEENPYLIDGCKKDDGPTKECRGCQDGGHSVHSFYDDRHFKIKLMALIFGFIIASILSLWSIIYALQKITRTFKKWKQRNNFYKRNGGLLLKRQQEADPSLVDKTIHFISRELRKATNNFSEDRILGRGGYGTVYKGMLADGRIVAVKKSKLVDESQLEQFINEVLILSQINHRNVVRLLGCCLESEVPILVSEFIPNGTLFDLLHNGTGDFPIPFNMRLQIAIEVAGALAYLHSSISIPIYHRDIKTSNILLDDKYMAKVSDFGTSRFVKMEKTHLTTLIKGTLGYLDPEYSQSSQLTEKSDVYSFGVVLVELLTRERALSLTRFGENRSLATHFMLAMKEGRVMSIFDAVVFKEGTRDVLLILADLAMRCLNLNGKCRPTVKEVVMELEAINSRISPRVQTNTGPVVYMEDLSMVTSEESLTTFFSCNNSISQ